MVPVHNTSPDPRLEVYRKIISITVTHFVDDEITRTSCIWPPNRDNAHTVRNLCLVSRKVRSITLELIRCAVFPCPLEPIPLIRGFRPFLRTLRDEYALMLSHNIAMPWRPYSALVTLYEHFGKQGDLLQKALQQSKVQGMEGLCDAYRDRTVKLYNRVDPELRHAVAPRMIAILELVAFLRDTVGLYMSSCGYIRCLKYEQEDPANSKPLNIFESQLTSGILDILAGALTDFEAKHTPSINQHPQAWFRIGEFVMPGMVISCRLLDRSAISALNAPMSMADVVELKYFQRSTLGPTWKEARDSRVSS